MSPQIAKTAAPSMATGTTSAPLRRYWPALAGLAFAIALPWLFYDYADGRQNGFTLSVASLIGVMMIFAMSYNILLGQTGLLSFGHAIYYGLGGYVSIHVLNMMADGSMLVAWLPTELLPLVGGLWSALFGAILGIIQAPHRAVAFAMITLGIGELMTQVAITFHSFFGGENGISAWRDSGWSLVGLAYGRDIEVYYLIIAWLFVSVMAMYLQTKTPLGRMANAARDNFERTQYVGYDYRRVRYFQIVLSAFFAGVAGSLFAMKDEILTFESLGIVLSANVLIMTFIGGSTVFFGPMIGAAVVILIQTWIGGISSAWMLYIGVLFIFMVLYAPMGIAGLIMLHEPYWQTGRMRRLWVPYLRTGVPLLITLAGAVAIVEILAWLSIGKAQGKSLYLFWMELADRSAPGVPAVVWAAALASLICGGFTTWGECRRTGAILDEINRSLKAEHAP